MTNTIRRTISATMAVAILMSASFANTGTVQANERTLGNQERRQGIHKRHRRGHGNADAEVAVGLGLLLLGVMANATPAQSAPRHKGPKNDTRADIRTDVAIDGWTDNNWARSQCKRVAEWKALVKAAKANLARDRKLGRDTKFSKRDLEFRKAKVKQFKANCKKARARLAGR